MPPIDPPIGVFSEALLVCCPAPGHSRCSRYARRFLPEKQMLGASRRGRAALGQKLGIDVTPR
ncbi:hypothetical protein HMPREF9622_00429 [Cutibacterium modestum HL037PA3]|nr:hypothetical protein HMPREF9622_00429 [Cutibacterium modestum HL037PA3]